MFKKVPRNVDLKVGSIPVLSTLKDDLDLYLQFARETSGEEVPLGDVLAHCIRYTLGNDRVFSKYKREAGQKKA